MIWFDLCICICVSIQFYKFWQAIFLKLVKANEFSKKENWFCRFNGSSRHP